MMRGTWPSFAIVHVQPTASCVNGASGMNQHRRETQPSRDHQGQAGTAQQNPELIKGWLVQATVFGGSLLHGSRKPTQDLVSSLSNIVKDIWDYLECIGYDNIFWLKVNLDSQICVLQQVLTSFLSLSFNKIFSRTGAQGNAWNLGSASSEQIQCLGASPA